jgi:hypothetical protein
VPFPLGCLANAEPGFRALTLEGVVGRQRTRMASYIIVRLSFVNAA